MWTAPKCLETTQQQKFCLEFFRLCYLDSTPDGVLKLLMATVRVTGLQRPWKHDALLHLLSRYGEVVDLSINSMRSECIVTFRCASSASAAESELNGVVWPIGCGILSISKCLDETGVRIP